MLSAFPQHFFFFFFVFCNHQSLICAGTWKFQDTVNSSSKFPDFRNQNGNSVIELVTSPTKITGVHYVQVTTSSFFFLYISVINFERGQGAVVFHDVFDNEHNVGGAQIKVEGVYIWPFRQLRLVANRSLPITSVFDYSNCDFFFKDSISTTFCTFQRKEW